MRSAAMTDFIERVREASDIVSVVSSYVPLKRKGNNYWGCCPFHQEKTPSFSVNGDKGLFYCFGCHAGGNVFKFISLVENVSFFEALKLQADRLGMPLPEEEKSPEERQRDEHYNQLRQVLQMARDYFHNCLTKTEMGAVGRSYWASRGIGPEIISEFSLGFSPNSFDKFNKAFRQRGISEALLLEAGLVKNGERGGVYDRFRNRVMIPIADERGRIVAFGGRVMDSGEPKYLNSPETTLFNKRRMLFGLDRAAKAIRTAEKVVVVEGYMDAISLAAAGIRNVVASLGTAFTREQCRLLMRYAPEIYFCYDSDAAGQNATMRALGILREVGAKAKVLIVPEGKDPDEFVRRQGKEAFARLIDEAQPVVDYQLNYLFGQAQLGSESGRQDALKSVLPVLYSVKDDVVNFNLYVRQVAGRLSIDEGLITQSVSRYRPQPEYTGGGQMNRSGAAAVRSGQQISGTAQAAGDKTASKVRVEQSVRSAGRVIVRQLWQDAGALPYLLAEIPLEDYPDPLIGGIIASFAKDAAAGRELSESSLDEAAAAELSRAVMSAVPGEDLMGLFEECIVVIRRAILQNKYEEQRLLADALDHKGNTVEALAALREASRLKKEMDGLDSGKKFSGN
ncbi:MAG: DNA primase [Selenomonadaceae bacterium]|nr:DNA primase [Selenomonadaceae bacterium]